MKNCLLRTSFAIILFSLCFGNGVPFVDTTKEGIFGANEFANIALAWEEETESNEKGSVSAEAFKLEKGGDGDGGEKFVKKLRFCKAPTSSLFAAFGTLSSLSFNLSTAKKSSSYLASSRKLLHTPKPLLYLLFHNIKSDLAHPAA
jgi:hypothetical protein